MGCSTSRLDNEEVVMLCKERKKLIKQAMENRHALAEAHVSYILSLRNIGCALRLFAEMKNITLGDNQLKEETASVLTLPTTEMVPDEPVQPLPEKCDMPDQSGSAAPNTSSTPRTSSPAENSPSSSSCSASPFCDNSNDNCCDNDDDSGSPDPSFETPHYLRSKGNPSTLVEENHQSPETLKMNSYVHSHYAATDFFQPPIAPLGSSGSISRDPSDPPPPPPPPRNFAWDFLNPFSPLEDQFGLQGNSRTSQSSEEHLKQVKEEEGIPDLEEDGVVIEEKKVQFEEETVKTVDSAEEKSSQINDQVPASSCVEENGDSNETVEEENMPIMEGHASPEGGNEQAVEVVDALSNEVSEKKDLAVVDSRRTRNLIDVMKDIEDQFTRAYVSGKELLKMLEANKAHFHTGFSEIKEQSAKVLHAITWHRSICSPSSLSKSSSFSSPQRHSNEINGIFTEDSGMMSGSHSTTLQRLYAWEKKLYEEVKAGERTRIIYEKKCSQLRNQDAKGEDTQAVDKTRAAIKDLHTRIRVAIQAIDSVSKKIQKLRDEELQPQLLELSQGFMQMWKVMLESHETQNQIIAEAQCLANSAGGSISSDSHRRATQQLESELRKWQSNFSKWIAAQKAYVRALNGWLLKCIIQEPEFSSKGIIQFSPRRFGAPPIFSICKHWALLYEKLPESAVIDSIRSFAGDIRCLLLRQDEEQRQKWKADRLAKDFDRRVIILQRFESTMLAETEFTSTEKCESDSGQTITPISERRMYLDSLKKQLDEERAKHLKVIERTRHATLSTLHNGLKFIFEALTGFAADSLKSYEEICRLNEQGNSIH